MKNLATCKPTEFISQTTKIKGAVKDWLTKIDVVAIRSIQPVYETLPAGATAEERTEVIKRNAERQQKQGLANLEKILDNMLVAYPQETLNVMALCCFVEPQDVDNHTMSEYMECIMDMVQHKSVRDFFSLLAQLTTRVNSI